MRIKFWQSLSAALALAVIATPAFGQTTIVNDSFTDGDRSITNMSGTDIEAAFFSTSNSSAIEDTADDGALAGGVGLVTGTSGRQIHAVFNSQTLSNANDTITSYLTFQTPGFVSSTSTQAQFDAAVTADGDANASTSFPATSDDIRIGLFQTSTGDNLTGSFGLAADISNGTDSQNPALFISGYAIELDVEPSGGNTTNIDTREYDAAVTSGRLLGTNGAGLNSNGIFTDDDDANIPEVASSVSFGSTPDLGYSFQPNTEYSVHTTYTLLADGSLDILTDLQENGVSLGTSLVNDPTPITLEFGTLAIGASSEAFGLSNDTGEADNGITLTNFTLTSDIATAAVPEPSSLALLGLMGCVGFMRRRR